MSASDPGGHKRKLAVNGVPLTDRARMLRPLAAAKARRAARATLPFSLTPPTIPAGVEPPKRKSRLGADYDTTWARSYPARAARVLLVEGVVGPAMRAIASPDIRGVDRLADLAAERRPVIFAANHHSHIDTPLLVSSVPEPWRHHLVVGAAADYFFGTKVTAPLSALAISAIPIERQKVSRRSADEAAELIGDGWSILIFPEGGRSPDGWGQPFRGGAAYLAARCDVAVIPVHLEGTGRILRKGHKMPRRSDTTVTFGPPVHQREGEDTRRFASRIEAEVAALADEIDSDWWQARRRAHAGVTPGLQAPAKGAWRQAWALGNRSPRTRYRSPSWP